MKNLTHLTAFLVFLIAAAGFALSYQALHAYALTNGIGFNLAWLWPLVIDGFMIVISLSILRASLLEEPVKYLWGLAILATGVSIIFNIAHAPPTLAGRAVAMVAPVAMFLAFEVFILQIKRNSERAGMQGSYLALQGQVKAAQGELTKMQGQAEKMQETLKISKEEIKAMQTERKEAQALMKQAQAELSEAQALASEAQGGDSRSKMITYFIRNPRASQDAAAQEAGVSRARIGQLLDELAQALPLRAAALPVNGKVKNVSRETLE